MPRFCAFPEHAQPIAQRLVVEARRSSRDLSAHLARLHHGREEYTLDYMSVVDLESLKRLLIEMTVEVDEILEVQSPGEIVRPVLAAAE